MTLFRQLLRTAHMEPSLRSALVPVLREASLPQILRDLDRQPTIPHEEWEDMPDEIESVFKPDGGRFMRWARQGGMKTLTQHTVQTIPLRGLKASQESVSRSKIKKMLGLPQYDTLPVVLQWKDGSRVIVDGTHRLDALARLGKSQAKVQLFVEGE